MGGGGIGPIAGIFGGVLHLAGPAMALIIPLWLAATFATARTVFHSKVKRRTEELERLAELNGTGECVRAATKVGWRGFGGQRRLGASRQWPGTAFL